MHVSDVLRYDRDIKPYRFIKIFAGVGSGKSTLIKSFIKGDNESKFPKKTVLFITSRKATVDETISSIDVEGKEGLKKWDKKHLLISNNNEKYDSFEYRKIPTINNNGIMLVKQESVVCTNAFIKYYFKNIYNPSDSSTFLWELFDIIAVDEVHSLVTDATYQSAPFYVDELIRKTLSLHEDADKNNELRRPLCEHIILMTGTPNPVKDYAKGLTAPKLTKQYNLFKTCENVVPQNIFFLTTNQAKEMINSLLRRNKKFVYFSNHTMTPDEFKTAFEIDNSPNIAVSFSKKDKRDDLKPFDNEQMILVENTLREKNMLPEEVQVFVTTSRNKEGINIENPDIEYMFIESHDSNDIIQMAGRIREGLRWLFIIIDSQQYPDNKNIFERVFDYREIASTNDNLGSANSFFKKLCEVLDAKELFNNPDIKIRDYSESTAEIIYNYIEFIHKKFPYVRYSYINNAFFYYSLREEGEKIYSNNTKSFHTAKKKGKHFLERLCEKWFKNAHVIPTIIVAMTKEERASDYIKNKILKNGSNVFSKSQKDEMVKELKIILGLNEGKNLKAILDKHTVYTCEANHHSKYKIFLKE